MLIVHLSMQCVHLGWSRHHHVCMKDCHNCMSIKYGSGRFCFFKNLFCSALLLFILLLKYPILLKILLIDNLKKKKLNDYCTASWLKFLRNPTLNLVIIKKLVLGGRREKLKKTPKKGQPLYKRQKLQNSCLFSKCCTGKGKKSIN